MANKEAKPEYPSWICADCGDQWGNRICGLSTWHRDRCGICGQIKIVTEPRDFGHLKPGWEAAVRKAQ